MGNGSVIVPGDVQRMSAGSGVMHSEFNPSHERAACTSCRSGSSPRQRGIAPCYEQKRVDADAKRGRLRADRRARRARAAR